MREYEAMLILPPDADDAAVDAAVQRIAGILTERGGEVGRVDRWGRRRLAYEIAHNTEGYYVLVGFRAEPGAIPEIDRVLHLADEVIRFKVVLRQAA